MSAPIQPDQQGLLWGYSKSFWHVLRAERAPAPPLEESCKWFAFLPSRDAKASQASFERLARNLFNDPQSHGLCDKGKFSLQPLFQTPDRLVVIFYGHVEQKEALKALVEKHAKAERKRLLSEGLVRARDGFLSQWTYKTDAQTAHELQTGTSAAHLSLLLNVLEIEANARRPKGPGCR